ncbi:MAG TPA: hypothetical protein VN715_21680 [Roseiarcus sp.]|nr:hypothetical protein [Roseiarcus sp.]
MAAILAWRAGRREEAGRRDGAAAWETRGSRRAKGCAARRSGLSSPRTWSRNVSAVAFDTLKFAKTLRDKAKFSPEQAEGLSEAFAQAGADQLATKTAIADLRSDLRETVLRLEAAIKSAIVGCKADILKWMFGTIGFQTVVILGAVLALSRFGH